MNKVIGFELKKMVSRPGIYVLAVLLAILLTVTAFIYKPTEEKKVYNKLDGDSLIAINSDFNNNYKSSYNSIIEDTIALAENVSRIGANEYKENITQLLNAYLEDFETFSNKSTNIMYTEAEIQTALNKLHNSSNLGSLDILYNKILENCGKEEDKFHPISMSNKDYSDLLECFDNIIVTLSNSDFSQIAKQLYKSLNPKLTSLIEKIKYPDYSNSVKNYLTDGDYTKKIDTRLNNIHQNMLELVAKVNNEKNANENVNYIKEYNDLFNDYRFSCELFYNMLLTDLDIDLLSSYSKSERTDVRFYTNVEYYNLIEQQTRYDYYFKNNKTDLEFANALSFDYASNEKTNGYDYSYFALSIFSVILIMFAITMASHSIAGETSEGTMRFVSIRPVSRSKILLGKFLSIAIMTLILLIFSSLASLAVGAFTFGMSSEKILTVINATNVVVLHPALALIIFLASQYLILLVYTSLAMLLTSFLKSDLLTLVLTLFVYVLNLLLPIFFNFNSFLRFNPFTNINLYAYVGAGTQTAKTIIGKVFTSVVYSGMTIWISIIFIVAMILIFNMLAIALFKRREL